jgi:isoleucyl-tRNA synthetase
MAQNKDDKEIAGAVKSPIAEKEEKVLQFWKDKKIFEKSVEKEAPKGDFVFYEGPPTANGRPGVHHLESRAFKDIIPRYKTMRGFRVERQAGWDTHGLPVELEVEKKLGLKSKKEIEVFGIEKFNEECKKSVWTYVDEWRNFTERIGYWVDLDNPYVTYKPNYIESVWNIVSEIEKQKLIYKDYRVVPWCPRDGTALSSHELAQGYQDDKDLSVTAKFELVDQPGTFFLAWTTTPWTLLGNVGLAVGPLIEYVKVKTETGIVILAKERLASNFKDTPYEVLEEMKGSDLVGTSYKPAFSYFEELISGSEKEKMDKAYKVYGADFVTTTDGTGIVHTAVMYGQEDFELGTKVGLPKFHTVDTQGNFIQGTGPFEGRFVKDEEVAVDIIKDLAHRGLLFKKEKYEHSYPHCWRCKTPLIYYARDSWYISMSTLREKLLKENEDIHWEPSYIRDGRFGEWLREVKDWAISRERYWGTPLPIWTNADNTQRVVIDSIETLKKHTKSNGNTFMFVRHGEAENNVKNIASSDPKSTYGLSEKGKGQVIELAKKLKSRSISAVYTSPFMRTRQTAHMISDEISFDTSKIVEDPRIGEYNFGDFDGKPFAEYLQHEADHMSSYETPVSNGESYLDAKKRFGQFLFDIDSKHTNETIVVVTHGIGLETISAVIEGADMARSKEIIDTMAPVNGHVVEFPFVPFPHNENFELDLHRPYIDDVVLLSEDGTELHRIKEVMDVWFDSGAMPFARKHYPFENKEWVDSVGFPADYISEGIDQTRGWFYTLHAIGTLLGKGKAYKNVICLGLVLDKDGQKMSKSRGNAVNPWEMIEKYGVDPLRYFMYSVNQPGDSKNFDERTVDEVVKKVFNLLTNVVKFYELYGEKGTSLARPESPYVLDQWIIASLDSVSRDMAKHLDEYKVFESSRLIRDFIADLSQWYLRRSRDRFKSEDMADRKAATETLGYVLITLSKLMAPFMPFYAEDIFQTLRSDTLKESVHLEEWPIAQAQSDTETHILTAMDQIRKLTTVALEARTKSGFKVRQPLALLTVKNATLKNETGLLEILKDEINVKHINFDEAIESEVLLDTHVTPELKQEGDVRELMRAIQDMRKEKNFSAGDKVDVALALSAEGKEAVEVWKKEIITTCSVANLTISDLPPDSQSWFSITL